MLISLNLRLIPVTFLPHDRNAQRSFSSNLSGNSGPTEEVEFCLNSRFAHIPESTSRFSSMTYDSSNKCCKIYGGKGFDRGTSRNG